MKLELRSATPEDAEAIADLQVAGWETAFQPLLPPGLQVPAREEFMVMGERALAAQGVIRTVAVDGDDVVGLCSYGPSRDDDAPPAVGEIRAMFVHPDYWRRGIGSALVETALENLREAGFTEATLWSFRDNVRANAFYERLGFTPDGASQGREEFRGTREIRYRRSL